MACSVKTKTKKEPHQRKWSYLCYHVGGKTSNKVSNRHVWSPSITIRVRIAGVQNSEISVYIIHSCFSQNPQQYSIEF
jgi:hypothetical protein